MKTVFTLHLGAQEGARPPLEAVRHSVRRCFDSFSLIAGEGWFRSTYDPGWSLKVATHDLTAVAELATRLRRQFSQDGVGIEVHGSYLRCTAHCEGAALICELRSALPDRAFAVQPDPPSPWHALRKIGRNNTGDAQTQKDYLRALSAEWFAHGRNALVDSRETEITEGESGPSGWLAQTLAQREYAAVDLDALVALEPRFAPLREALASLPR